MITRAIIQPFIHMLMAGALLFSMAALLVDPFMRLVVLVTGGPSDDSPWLWVKAAGLAILSGCMWAVAWLWFKRSERKCLDALDQRRDS